MANEPKHEYDAVSYLGSRFPSAFFFYILFAFPFKCALICYEVAID
jgi:hypothetical protein